MRRCPVPKKITLPNWRTFYAKCVRVLIGYISPYLRTASIKNLQKCYFKCPQYSFLSSRKLEKHFLRSFLWPNFDLNSSLRFASLSQKMVSTLSLKNFQKTEKHPFQTLRTVAFDSKVAAKLFIKKIAMTKFSFKQFLMFCLIFPENGFNWKTCKKLKNAIFKGSEN